MRPVQHQIRAQHDKLKQAYGGADLNVEVA